MPFKIPKNATNWSYNVVAYISHCIPIKWLVQSPCLSGCEIRVPLTQWGHRNLVHQIVATNSDACKHHFCIGNLFLLVLPQ
jgi:hypothetical protein